MGDAAAGEEQVPAGDEAALAQQLEREAVALSERVRVLRETNLSPEKTRLSEADLRKLDSTLKKNTAFTKKVKAGTVDVEEARKLNLSRYVEELVQAIAHIGEAKKPDIPGTLELACLLHQRYEDFSTPLREAMKPMMQLPKAEDREAITEFRTTLRVFVELILAGVFPDKDINGVTKLLKMIAKPEGEPAYISVIISFLKSLGSRVVGVVSRKHRVLAEKFGVSLSPTIVFPAQAEELRTALISYYDHVASLLVSERKQLLKKRKKNESAIQMHGSVSDERQEELANMEKEYEKLFANVTALADLLDRDLPDLPEEEPDEIAQAMNIDFSNSFRTGTSAEEDFSNSLWEDRETALFYESITDIRHYVPEIVFGGKGATSTNAASTADEKKEEDAKKPTSKKERKTVVDEDGLEYEVEEDAEDLKEVLPEESVSAKGASASATSSSKDAPGLSFLDKLAQLFERLPKLVNRDFVDTFAIDFCLLSSKSARRRLAEELYNVSYMRLDVLPYYARLVATLNPVFPDIAETLIELLEDQFRFLRRKHANERIESKIKNARFIGELTKFSVCPPGIAIGFLSQLVRDFKGHDIEVLSYLLESCGRFLYRNPITHTKMRAIVEVATRKLATLHTAAGGANVRLRDMLQNALVYVNPPPVVEKAKKVRPPLHEYLRKLLYTDLKARTSVIEGLSEKLLKMPWSTDPALMNYATVCFTRAWKVKYNNIASLASLLSSVYDSLEPMCMHVVENVLEEIRIGMEMNNPEMSQRRVAAVKYLAELFNYRLVESKEIFNTLYSLICFAAHLPRLDPPESFIRIKLVCVILDTCGQFFDRGKDRKRLDAFLTYFQRYVLTKAALLKEKERLREEAAGSASQSSTANTDASASASTSSSKLPMEVEFMLGDTFELLRPDLHIFDSLEEANAAVEAIEKEIQEKLKTSMPAAATQGSSSSNASTSASASNAQPPALLSSDSEEEEDEEEGERSRDGVRVDEEEEGGDSSGPQQQQNEEQSKSEDDVVLRKKHVEADPDPEDKEFIAQFEQMMSSSMQNRVSTSNVKSLDVSIPFQLRGKAPKLEHKEDGSTQMRVVLLTKNKNAKEVNVTVASSLAENMLKQQEAERKERELTKQFVKGYEEQAGDEFVQDMLSNFTLSGGSANSQRRDDSVQASTAQGQHAPGGFRTQNGHAQGQASAHHHPQRGGRGGQRGGNRGAGSAGNQRKTNEVGERWTGQPVFPTFK